MVQTKTINFTTGSLVQWQCEIELCSGGCDFARGKNFVSFVPPQIPGGSCVLEGRGTVGLKLTFGSDLSDEKDTVQENNHVTVTYPCSQSMCYHMYMYNVTICNVWYAAIIPVYLLHKWLFYNIATL